MEPLEECVSNSWLSRMTKAVFVFSKNEIPVVKQDTKLLHSVSQTSYALKYATWSGLRSFTIRHNGNISINH